MIAGTEPVLVHNNDGECPVGRLVKFGDVSEPLAHAAAERRFAPNLPRVSDGQNVAAARLSDGRVLFGVSRGNNFHSEDDIFRQLSEGDKIDALYSDRSPCGLGQRDCGQRLLDHNPKMDISYAVPYTDGAFSRSVNSAGRDLLKTMVANYAFTTGRRGRR